MLLFLSVTSNAQWLSDIRMTNNSANSYTSGGNGWCIASNGNIVHIVWYDYRDANWEIYYKRSTDGGASWGADTRLTYWALSSESPSIAVSGPVVHVVWHDARFGNDEIFYKRSTDNGLTWGADTRLTSNDANSVYASIAVSGSALHVVWTDNRDGFYQVYYKRSTDGGNNWNMDYRLTNTGSNNANTASVTVVGFVVHVAWADSRDGNWEIYYRRSTNSGSSWGLETRLTNSPDYSINPSIGVSGQSVHIVWRDYRNGNGEIYYKRSTNGGSSWASDYRMTNNDDFSASPNIAISDQIAHVVWADNRDGNWEIYYKRSTNGGSSWSSDTRLTNNSDNSHMPFIDVSGSVVNIVWYDYRDGNPEIYLKRNPTGNPVGIEVIGSELPGEFKLFQNYPNPFNPVTNIQFSIQKSGHVKLTVFDITGKEIASLINQDLNTGTYNYDFDASNLASGTYLYRLSAEGFTDIKKMMLVK